MSDNGFFYHYLPINDCDMRLGIYVTGCGYGLIGPGQAYPRTEHPGIYQLSWENGRVLPEFQIILITDGRGQFESRQTGLVEFTGDTLILLFPGVWHRYRPLKSTGWTERWVSLHGEFVHRLAECGSIVPEVAVLPLESHEPLLGVFDETLSVAYSDPVHHSAKLSIGALQLLAIASELTRNRVETESTSSVSKEKNVDDPLVGRALDVIWTRSHRPMSVQQLVEQLPTTRRTLERRMQACLGHTVLDEINRCRLSRAKRLLSGTNLPVNSVAYLAGFRCQERLRRLMVDKVGCSPSSYRMQTRSAVLAEAEKS